MSSSNNPGRPNRFSNPVGARGARKLSYEEFATIDNYEDDDDESYQFSRCHSSFSDQSSSSSHEAYLNDLANKFRNKNVDETKPTSLTSSTGSSNLPSRIGSVNGEKSTSNDYYEQQFTTDGSNSNSQQPQSPSKLDFNPYQTGWQKGFIAGHDQGSNRASLKRSDSFTSLGGPNLPFESLEHIDTAVTTSSSLTAYEKGWLKGFAAGYGLASRQKIGMGLADLNV